MPLNRPLATPAVALLLLALGATPAPTIDALEGPTEGVRILNRLKLPAGMLSEGYEVVIRKSPAPKIPRESQVAVLFFDRLLITVNHFEDIEPFITVTSDNDALEFARLHTRTFSGGFELAADGKTGFFEKPVPANVLQQAGVANPHIEKDDKGWTIIRYEIRPAAGISEIHKIQEHVSKESHYQLLSDQKKYAGDIPGIQWMAAL